LISPDLTLAVCRFVFDGAALFLWGAAIYLGTLVPSVLRMQVWTQLASSRRVACVCCALTSLASLPLHTAIIGDGWQDATHWSMLVSVANGTSIGTAWWCQLIASLLLAGAGALGSGATIAAHALASGLLLASLALTGHALLGHAWTAWLHQINDVLHLLSAGAWLGALPVVLLLLPRLREPLLATPAKTALMRFSTAGHVAVSLVLLSGIVSMFLIIGGLPLDWSYPYQMLLTLKIALVMLMALLALINRYLLLPRMKRSRQAAGLFFWVSVVEIGLSLLVILLVAWFGMLEPN